MRHAANSAAETELRRKHAVALLAAAWSLPAAALAGFLSMKLDAWSVPSGTLLVLGSPAIVLLDRVVVWGWAFAFFAERVSLVRLVFLGVLLDLMLPLDRGSHHPSWQFLFAEALAVGLCLLPAQLFARWTRERSHLTARNLMHLCFHSALLLGVWPLLITQFVGGNWYAWGERASATNKFYLQFLIFPCVFLITAMQEFHSAGKGTPMPEDAPPRLVTTGIFYYVANPMQIGKFGVLFFWGLFWRNPWIVTAAFLGLLYSITIARAREDRDMAARFGADWTNYRRNVRRWLPRWRPWIATAGAADSAALYLDLDCGPCSHFARWIAAQRPTQLRILPLAAHFPSALSRITYCTTGGERKVQGMQAIARALDHVNLAWAFCGWMLRLPLIGWIAELITEAVSPAAPEHCNVSGAATIVPSVEARS
ncbi:MAG TPA: isoprenylcysteine carboxylmethyltransferase family protein [Candidatus Acidoferrum sp.]|nr:isoprenylcysteine carboxylmethyltransferase family protein [Candidatus Acidoferrum sp.]